MTKTSSSRWMHLAMRHRQWQVEQQLPDLKEKQKEEIQADTAECDAQQGLLAAHVSRNTTLRHACFSAQSLGLHLSYAARLNGSLTQAKAQAAQARHAAEALRTQARSLVSERDALQKRLELSHKAAQADAAKQAGREYDELWLLRRASATSCAPIRNAKDDMMKIETGSPELLIAATKPLAHGQGQRWLAELEQAYLGSMRRSVADTGSAAQAPVASEPAARVSATVGDGAPAAGPFNGLSASAAAVFGFANASSVDMARDDGARAAALNTAPAAGPEQARMARQHSASSVQATELASTVANKPSSAPVLSLQSPSNSAAVSAALAETLDRHAAPHASEAAYTSPVRYAKQFMQITLSQTPQAMVRDASLTSAEAEAVARSVSQQLLADGTPLQRVFVNGQRYLTAHAPRPFYPSQPTPTKPEQE